MCLVRSVISANFMHYMVYIEKIFLYEQQRCRRERSDSVVECLTRDLMAEGLSLTGVTALCP